MPFSRASPVGVARARNRVFPVSLLAPRSTHERGDPFRRSGTARTGAILHGCRSHVAGAQCRLAYFDLVGWGVLPAENAGIGVGARVVTGVMMHSGVVAGGAVTGWISLGGLASAVL